MVDLQQRAAVGAGVKDLVTIAKCVGGRGLAAVCKLLAEDFSGWAGAPPASKLAALLDMYSVFGG